MTKEKNKKIISNTIFMYLRMLFSLVVSLYTSRVVLHELGVENFGIYTIVGGVVAMFSFLNSSMGTATSRFFTFEIGKKGDVQTVFISALIIHVSIALLVFTIGLSLGYSIVFKYINIEFERLLAAKWVYGFSLLTACLAIFQVPYSALILSHERFKVFAYLDMLAVLMKLGIVYCLSISSFDKLITYAGLIFLVSLIVFLLNLIYATRAFGVSHLQLRVKRSLIKDMLSFSFWDLYGNASVLARTQGVNILLNLFFGALINAASGIAMQVQSAVMSFAGSALAAVKPQIVKSYASGDYERTIFLVFNLAKFTYFILLMISLPLILEMHYVLTLWLHDVPNFAVLFCQYILVFNFIANLSSVVVSAIHATGHIKRPSLINGTLYLLVVPLAYCAYELKFPAEVAYQINIAMVVIGMLSNVWTLNTLLPGFAFSTFIGKVLLPCAVISCLVVIISFLTMIQFHPGMLRLFMVSMVCAMTTLVLVYFFAIDKPMRETIKNSILFRLKR